MRIATLVACPWLATSPFGAKLSFTPFGMDKPKSTQWTQTGLIRHD